MNKAKLAETGIIVIIIVLFYQLVTSLITAISGIYLLVASPFPRIGGSLFLYLYIFFPVILYLIAIYLLNFYKKNLAEWLAGNEDEAVALNVSPLSILYVALFCICIVSLFNDLPVLLSSVFDFSAPESSERGLGMPDMNLSGFAKMQRMAGTALFIRLLLTVICLAIASAKLFSSTRTKNEGAE
ncbi:MAG: hypothetical protein NTW29_05995 [Bacteroidetes bacterium]|nr:hypothetical protein [Bacteroidota bacterium]